MVFGHMISTIKYFGKMDGWYTTMCVEVVHWNESMLARIRLSFERIRFASHFL
jgi:hypothetical protein